jgi:hypothetical protein
MKSLDELRTNLLDIPLFCFFSPPGLDTFPCYDYEFVTLRRDPRIQHEPQAKKIIGLSFNEIKNIQIKLAVGRS